MRFAIVLSALVGVALAAPGLTPNDHKKGDWPNPDTRPCCKFDARNICTSRLAVNKLDSAE
ncbi:hypothetical protein E4U55_001114 [Claviceps digitariae]|nr:hypothetical protein E4U55_001114 [Claviceps digitariae]